MRCGLCGSGPDLSGWRGFWHDACRAERSRRIQAGLCERCGLADMCGYRDKLCASCGPSDPYRGYPGGS